MTFKIGFDIDDVVLDYVNSFLRHINRTVGTRYTKKEVTSYDSITKFRTPLPFRSSWSIHHDYPDHEDFKDMHFIPGARQSIERIISEYDTSFITARTHPKSQQHVYDTWYNAGLPMNKLYFSQDKGRITKQLGISAFVDDATHNIANIITQSPRTKPIIFSQPWNKDKMFVEYVNSWDDIERRIPDWWYAYKGVSQ